jgi:hypothetical protein
LKLTSRSSSILKAQARKLFWPKPMEIIRLQSEFIPIRVTVGNISERIR